MNNHDKSLSELKNQFNITGKNATPKHSTIVTRCASDIAARPIKWLWVKRFAKGKLSMIAGEPGLGKSQVTISMTANVTTGKAWPDGEQCELGNVLFLSAEDDAADTIIPRLIAAGANLSHVHIIDAVKTIHENGAEALNQFSLADDLTALEKKITDIGNVSALFIDPITSYLGGRIDDHKNAAVRSILTPLSKFAEKYHIAVICVTHLNKNEAQNAIHRVVGSIGYVAAARSVFVVIKDENVNNRRLFLPIKNNIGNDTTGLAFDIEACEIENNIKTTRLVWNNEIITKKADDFMSPQQDNDDKSAREDAKEFLREMLEKEPMYFNDILEQAKLESIAEKTLRRAAKDLGIHKSREGFGKGSKAFWSLQKVTNSSI